MTKSSLYTCLGFACLCLALAGSTPAQAQVPTEQLAPQPPPPPLIRPDVLPTDPQQRYSLLGQTQVLRAQIEDLRIERSRYGIAGPIAMMAGGGAVTLGALYVYALSEAFSDLGCNSGCSHDNSNLNSFLAVVGVGGIVTAVVGLVILQNRLEPRRELGRQITAKRTQLKAIEDRVRFSTMMGPQNVRGASVLVTF